MTKTISLATLRDIALDAGKEILKIYYHDDFSKVVDFKADSSPLTLADRQSHQTIAAALGQHYPDIPLISEEGKEIAYETRKNWEYCWLVDPLDGTKEFIKRNGQFTVNIALIHRDKPVAGVIYAPVTDELYLAAQAGYTADMAAGAYKQHAMQEPVRIRVRHKSDLPDRQTGLTAVRSSSHASREEEDVLKEYGVTESIAKGSSLKFCMIAEGKADLYYRHGPTMEWDTAAGQALVECAGGKVYQGTSRTPFAYNKPSLLNDSFLVLAG